MKFLKLLIVSFICILSTSFVIKDDVIPTIKYDESKSQTYDVSVYKDWTPSGAGYWTDNVNYYTYNDFDWMITRSTNKVNGYYYFDFWFFSQSYYWDGYNASYTSTNMRNVNVYVDGVHYTSDYSSLGITFNQTYNATSIRIITKNPQPRIYFKWDYMNAK